MEVIVSKVPRQRSIYGLLLRNWLITEAVLMNGSMTKIKPAPADTLTACEELPACSYCRAPHINR